MCGRSIARIEGSNLADGIGVLLVLVVCCVGSDFCEELMARSEESYRECVCVCARVCVCVCLIVCDLETSTVRRSRLEFGCCATEKYLIN